MAKKQRIEFDVTPDEKAQLQHKAQTLQLSLAEYLRRGALGRMTTSRRDQQHIAQLGRIGRALRRTPPDIDAVLQLIEAAVAAGTDTDADRG